LEKKRKKTLHQIHELNLSYRGECGNFHILGEIPLNLSHFRVTILFLERSENNRYRAKIDLYENKEIERFCYEILESEYGLDFQTIRNDFRLLIEQLENHRNKLFQKTIRKRSKSSLEKKEKDEINTILLSPDLLKELDLLLENAGIIGENANRLLLFLVAVSYRAPFPLHAIIQSASGAGKSHLLKVLSQCLPGNDVLSITRMTGKSLYYYNNQELVNKSIFIQDLDGLKDEALFSFRELQSEKSVSISSTYKDRLGNFCAKVRTVEAHFSSIASSTKTTIYQDNLNRSIPIQLDESQEQSRRIIEYQNKQIAGEINAEKQLFAIMQLQHLVKQLNHVNVINPCAPHIHLPENTHYSRRTNLQLQHLILLITFIHQHQRKKDKDGNLIVTVPDVESAIELFIPVIELKIDDLDGQSRLFYEKLKTLLIDQNKATFSQVEIRKSMSLSKTQTFRFIQKLINYEYISIISGTANKGYVYQLNSDDNYNSQHRAIKTHFAAIIENVKALDLPL
jgi:hypothetical protein